MALPKCDPSPAPEMRLEQLNSGAEKAMVVDRSFDSSSSHSDLVEVKNSPSTNTDTDSEILIERAIGKNIGSQHIIPDLFECSWPDFANDEDGDPRYAIEVLPARASPHEKNVERRYKKPRPQTPTAAVSGDDGKRPVPECIRINSPLILKTLAGIDRHIEVTKPMVMLRPFKFLVDYHAEIQESIGALEKQIHDADTSLTPSLDLDQAIEEVEASRTQTPDALRRTLQHMQCLTHFFDQYIKPTLVRLKDGTDPMIYFSDLWYIFRPGEDIFVPLKDSSGSISGDAIEATPETFQRRYNMLWRVTHVRGGYNNSSNARRDTEMHKPRPFIVEAYYIDFDGKYFFPLVHTFSIMPFIGVRDVNSLELLPVRLSRDAEKLQAHSERGKGTFDGITKRVTHFYYEGPTLIVQPCGCPLQSEPLAQEHIESEVIVDFRVTLLHNQSWRPKPDQCKNSSLHGYEREDESRPSLWNEDPAGEEDEDAERDFVLNDDFVDEENAKTFRHTEKIFGPIPRGWESNESMVPVADPGLLCGRVFAFVLRTRTFAPLWVWLLQPIRPQTDGLNTLQLRDNTLKDIIHALVKTHFVRKTAQQHSKEYDIVRGKGKGLVILLHGAPGVGKTLTAESVAAACGRPLLQITCGDLGMTPGDVEKRLKEIFRYAQLWNCVLLLDECDIFLTQRTKTDIVRNSLVSTFLRVLEFHSGVLFLTTNRVGVLDDAIKSRITWSVYYPPLNWKQTKEIWKANIKLHKERNETLDIDDAEILRFAKEHFKNSSAQRPAWNGRQIQNAFKVATALAEWDVYSEEDQRRGGALMPENSLPSRPRLVAEHFHKVAEGTSRFDDYMQEATGTTGAERAFNAMERYDEFHVPHDSNHIGRSKKPPGHSKNSGLSAPHWSSANPSPPTTGFPTRHSEATSVFPPSRSLTALHQSSYLPRRQSNSSVGQNDHDSGGPPQGRRRKSSTQMPTISPSMDSQFQMPRSPSSSANYPTSPYLNDHGKAARPMGWADHESMGGFIPAARRSIGEEEYVSDSDDEESPGNQRPDGRNSDTASGEEEF